MKHKYYSLAILAIAISLFRAAPAAAQTQPIRDSKPAVNPASINMGYAGIITGTQSVKNTGGVFGGEAGARVWRHLDIVLEGAALSDVVSQSQIDVAAPLVTSLQTTQGQQASANVKRPAAYFGVGARWVFEDVNIAGWAKPYAQFTVGGARVKREPTLTLGGTDITSSASQYGVVLGADMTSTENVAAVSGGAGLLVPYRMLYFDVGFRFTDLATSGSSTNVTRLHIGIGARF